MVVAGIEFVRTVMTNPVIFDCSRATLFQWAHRGDSRTISNSCPSVTRYIKSVICTQLFFSFLIIITIIINFPAMKVLALIAAVVLATITAADASPIVVSEKNPLAQVSPQMVRETEVVPAVVAVSSKQELHAVAELDAPQATGARLGRARLAKRAHGTAPGVAMMTTHGMLTATALPFAKFSDAILKVLYHAWLTNDWYGAQTIHVGSTDIVLKWSLPKIEVFSHTAIDFLCDEMARSQKNIRWIWAMFNWATAATAGGSPEEIVGSVAAYIQPPAHP